VADAEHPLVAADAADAAADLVGEGGEDAVRESREMILKGTQRADALSSLPVRLGGRAGIGLRCSLGGAGATVTVTGPFR